MSMFKPIQVILTVIIISVVSLVLVSSDILDGGTCNYGATTGTVASPGAQPVGGVYTAAKSEQQCTRLIGSSGALTIDADATNNYQQLVWTYDLDAFPGFRSLALLVPLVLIGLVVFTAWRSGSFGGRGGGMG